MKRVSLSKRVRFEVLKRDGFRCRYCGATPTQQVLHIDHIIPVCDGGTNDSINLVAACQTCNSGKSSKRLDSQSPPPPATPSKEELAEQRRQVKAYLSSQKEIDRQREEVTEFFCQRWDKEIGPLTVGAESRLRNLSQQVSGDIILEAIRITASSKMATPGAEFDSRTAVNQLKYFNVVLRNIREGREWRKW